MSWAEFSALLGSLGYESPLGKMVAIRSEKDPAAIKKMTPEQKRIRSAWRRKEFERHPPKDAQAFINEIQSYFAKAGRREQG